MEEMGILVKSYADDLPYAIRLIASLRRHNNDLLPVYLVVPDADISLFKQAIGSGCELLGETSLGKHLVARPEAGFSAGYINQEIVKLAFWELGLVKNYLCVDSDAQFIRSFGVHDLMADATTPYTILTEDNDLKMDPHYFNKIWQGRAEALKAIAREVGLVGQWPLTVHGHAIFSGKVLESLRQDFLSARGWGYVDALRLAPYEPSWYNAWLLHRKPIPIVRREPLVKTFHTPVDHLDYALRGLGLQDVARGFLAVVVNSNFTRGQGVLSLSDPLDQTLASHISVPDLMSSLLHKISPWKQSPSQPKPGASS